MSAEDTYIITGAQVREICFLADGVEDRKLNHSIKEAQHRLEQILGVTLYALVEASDPVGDPTMGGDAGLVSLFAYCQPLLAWETLEDAYPELSAEADRNGVFTKSGDDYTSVSEKRLTSLIAKARSRADRWQMQLLHYLRNLTNTDPIKIAFDECVDDEPRVTKTYQAGIPTRRSIWQQQESKRGYNRHSPHDEC